MREVSIGRLRGGYCVYWRDASGNRTRRQLEARTRKEAEAEGLEVFRRATYTHRKKDPTTAEIWAAYVADLGDKPTAKTMGYTGKAVLQFFGHLPAEQITKATCEAYTKARLSDGKSVGTAHTELGHLTSALRFAKTTRMIDRVPQIWRPSKPETDKRILNAAEARALIDAAHDPHIKLALVLMLGTGARVGAILDLTWDRVDFERGTINLRLSDSITRKGRATVPMNGMTRPALSVARNAALSDYVVEYATGPVKNIRKGVMGAVARSGIGHVRIHDLRHTAAVTMLAAGHPIEMVAQVLGHSNVSMTYKVYGRYLPESMAPAVDVLNFTGLRLGSAN